MTPLAAARRQRGVITIFVAMVMLILITLLVTTAFSLSTTNLRAVGNVQARDEAIAAAQVVIEQILLEDAGLPAFQAARTEQVDIDGDGIDDYTVNVPAPVCVRATLISIESAYGEEIKDLTGADAWDTLWEINAVATDDRTGARVSVIQGVRVVLTSTEKNAVCI